MSGRPNATHFEVNGDANGVTRGTITGVDIPMRDFLALTETLMQLGWPIPADTLISNYKDVVSDLVKTLIDTVEYVGPPTLPAIEGWAWFDALVKYAPDTAAKFKDAWAEPEKGQASPRPCPTCHATDPAEPSSCPESWHFRHHAVDKPDVEWPLGGHPAHESWRADATATDYEQYVKGWDACLKSLMDEVELMAQIGERRPAQSTEQELERYQECDITNVERVVLRWLTKKVFDDGR